MRKASENREICNLAPIKSGHFFFVIFRTTGNLVQIFETTDLFLTQIHIVGNVPAIAFTEYPAKNVEDKSEKNL